MASHPCSRWLWQHREPSSDCSSPLKVNWKPQGLRPDYLTSVCSVQAFHVTITEEEEGVLTESCLSNNSGSVWVSE